MSHSGKGGARSAQIYFRTPAVRPPSIRVRVRVRVRVCESISKRLKRFFICEALLLSYPPGYGFPVVTPPFWHFGGRRCVPVRGYNRHFDTLSGPVTSGKKNLGQVENYFFWLSEFCLSDFGEVGHNRPKQPKQAKNDRKEQK